MSSSYFLFVGICLCIARNVYAKDLTLKPGETSNAVIDETIRKIRTKCILSADNYFLRRLAAAQMMSFANTTKGGIWRVTDAQLNTVKSGCNGSLKADCSQIKTDFNVYIPTLTMSDLAKPLYSGLVMSLFIMSLNKQIPVNKQKQAVFLVTYINPSGEQNDFINSANELEQTNSCASAQIDLVFVIDSSGSVGPINFLKTTEFLVNIVKHMDISPAKTRVAVVRFASTPTIMFGLGAYNTKIQVISAIRKVLHGGGGTETSLALAMARTEVFTTNRTTAASKVLVLVTDGKSNSELQTTQEAQLLKDENVIIYTIGVVNPNESELIAAASEPSCTHFIILKDYTEIGFIVKEIRSESCKAPTVVEEGSWLVNNSIPQNNETKQQVLAVGNSTGSSLRSTILVSVQCGVVTVYAAFNNSYPNEANYDYKTYATDDKPGKIFAVKGSDFETLVLTVFSKRQFDLNSTACDNPSYNISINPTVPTVEMACLQKYVDSPCTVEQFDSKCYNTSSVVTEVSQLVNNTIPSSKIKQQVLDISNSTHSSGSIIRVTVRCGVVTVYGAFNNSYPIEADHNYKVSATDQNPGELIIMKELELDQLTLNVYSEQRFDLNTTACDNPSYDISINPRDPDVEVVCNLKEAEKPCSTEELDSKCTKIFTTNVIQKMDTTTNADNAVNNLLYLNTCIYFGVALAWHVA